MVKITVCRSCGWQNDKIRRELKRLQRKHPDRVRILRKGCLDRGDGRPFQFLPGKPLAPARPKHLRRAVEKALGNR